MQIDTNSSSFNDGADYGMSHALHIMQSFKTWEHPWIVGLMARSNANVGEFAQTWNLGCAHGVSLAFRVLMNRQTLTVRLRQEAEGVSA